MSSKRETVKIIKTKFSENNDDDDVLWSYTIKPTGEYGELEGVIEWHVGLRLITMGEDGSNVSTDAGSVLVTVFRDWQDHVDISEDEWVGNVWDSSSELDQVGTELLEPDGGLKSKYMDLTYKYTMICFSHMEIAKTYRRKGGALFLINTIIRVFGYETAFYTTVVLDDNKPAMCLWKKAGFEQLNPEQKDGLVMISGVSLKTDQE